MSTEDFLRGVEGVVVDLTDDVPHRRTVQPDCNDDADKMSHTVTTNFLQSGSGVWCLHTRTCVCVCVCLLTKYFLV